MACICTLCLLCKKSLGRLNFKITIEDLKVALIPIPDEMKDSDRICKECYQNLQRRSVDLPEPELPKKSSSRPNIKYCKNCNQDVKAIRRVGFGYFIIMLVVGGIIFGFLASIYFFMLSSAEGSAFTVLFSLAIVLRMYFAIEKTCPICHADNWK